MQFWQDSRLSKKAQNKTLPPQKAKQYHRSIFYSSSRTMLFSSSTVLMYIIATVLVAFPALVVGQQQPATASPSGPITPSYQYDMYRNSLPTCFDYRAAFEISKGECNLNTLFNHIRAVYEEQSKENWALKVCRNNNNSTN